MNNSIEEAYCSFEVSKLLKEKGFDCRTNVFYNYNKQLSRYFNPDMDWNDINTQGLLNSKIVMPNTVCAPTHALAIEWLRVNFGKYIYAFVSNNPNNYHYYIETLPNFNTPFIGVQSHISFNSPQEATEMALLHVLKELI